MDIKNEEMKMDNKQKNAVMQELKFLECFLEETPEYALYAFGEAADYICERAKLNIERLIESGDDFLKEKFEKVWGEAVPNTSQALKHTHIYVAGRCNLNCKHCSVYAPIVAEDDFPDIVQIDKDIAKMGELTNGIIRNVTLLGGEPLLNPQLASIIPIVRKRIPYGRITILTNGILLTKMKEEFWIACRDNDARVVISQYPIKLDLDKINSIADKYEVALFIKGLSDRKGDVNTFWLNRLAPKGNLDIFHSYKNCLSKDCSVIKDGKFYTCARPYFSKYLEKKFRVKFSISSKDFLVLDKIKDLQEIKNFISLPLPFCRYCVVERANTFVEWKISERKKEEWIIDEN